MSNRGYTILFSVIAALVIIRSSTYLVREWEQAIVIELGKPKRTVTEAGLHFKIPMIENVVRFEKRLLEYDAEPRALITGDKQQVVVDNYSRWKIVDPLKFYQSVRTVNGAVSRLDDVIYSALREILGQRTLKDLISIQRSEICQKALDISNETMAREGYGIEVVDVRIKRADLPEKNTRNVFARMRTEREQLAKKYRAEGEEEARKIRSEAEKEARIILANAKKESEILRGSGDALSTKIYAKAYNQDPIFYEFVRTLDSYKKIFKDETAVYLTPDSKILKLLKKGQ
ncbi:MAG: protease modulator HflC [Bdellovibrionota bacterium]|nr:protease modulator HflC [Deltaproteobacteria bacterium]